MALRSVQLTESGSGDRKRVQHVIGVDESGNPNATQGPFVMVAVQCARSHGEKLARRLIESRLRPWRAKSKSLYSILDDSSEQTERVENFIEAIEPDEIYWSAAAGWESITVPERSAVAATVGSRTLTTPHLDEDIDIKGDAVLLPDGSVDTFGGKQRELRCQCASKFNSSFQTEFCSVFVSSLSKADYIYPESIAADYIAGYIRKKLYEGTASVETLQPQVDRIDTGWQEPNVSPLPLYVLRTSGAMDNPVNQARVIAWIEGRKPSQNPEFTTGNQYENIVDRLESPVVKNYLRGLSE